MSFQLTRPVWGEPICFCLGQLFLENFNSLAPCGANRNAVFRLLPRSVISTHSPRVGRTFDVCELNTVLVISTHSPRVGRTIIGICHTHCIANFNSLAPCGANHNRSIISGTLSKFQLTRPVWGEPIFAKILYFPPRISTHSPRVGRTPVILKLCDIIKYFNSLAPCGANLNSAKRCITRFLFQLTRPVWGEP